MYCAYIRKKITNSDVFMGMLLNCMIPQKRDFVYMRIMPIKFWYSCLYYVESVISWKNYLVLICADIQITFLKRKLKMKKYSKIRKTDNFLLACKKATLCMVFWLTICRFVGHVEYIWYNLVVHVNWNVQSRTIENFFIFLKRGNKEMNLKWFKLILFLYQSPSLKMDTVTS